MGIKLANDLEVIDNQSSVGDYISLLKPRVMALAVFTSLCGLCLAPVTIHPFMFVLSIFCISLGAGAAGAINMWFDRDIDCLMERTKKRPIPTGKIEAENALGFGIMLSLISVLILGLSLNYLAAFLLAFSIFFYIFIYTIWLKRRTPQNIVIGGAAGAFPPVIGWVCATGELHLFPFILFLLIFIWTPPHFWALALYKDIEYSKANVPMLPVVSGQRHTKVQVFLYSIILMIISTLPYFFSYSGFFYLITSILLGFAFLYLAYKVLKSDDKQKTPFAPSLFKFSILYLYLIFSSLVIDSYL
ncbi:MAG: protoheme IX farnesyltransferase [Alphaproteobacteria bacterium]|nr:protoheme IX farnesyltransferase [Alphaproteobacteria bacterium]